jgi:hypothetical protein
MSPTNLKRLFTRSQAWTRLLYSDLASLLSKGEDAHTETIPASAVEGQELQFANFDDVQSITPSWCVVV